MPALSLGVIELPYSTRQSPVSRRAVTKSRRGKGPVQRSMRSASGAQTTGDVASILEARYHVMEVFFELHAQEIADIIASHMSDALDSLLMGSPSTEIFPREGIPEIQKLFVRFINSEEMNGIQPGVPTKAAQRGVNLRMKGGRGSPRPSFRRTGLYMQSFRAWVATL